MNVLTDLKARGVEDILIACTDNLAGIRQAINADFPETVSQLFVHQIRNSSRYVVWKERKKFIADLKLEYGDWNFLRIKLTNLKLVDSINYCLPVYNKKNVSSLKQPVLWEFGENN